MKKQKGQEIWEIFDEPGGVIEFFSHKSPLLATIHLGQARAEVRQCPATEISPSIWELITPGDTAFFQAGTSGFRLFKKIQTHPHSAILSVRPETVEVDLLHFFPSNEDKHSIHIESQRSLEDFSELFPIVCLMMMFRNQAGT